MQRLASKTVSTLSFPITLGVPTCSPTMLNGENHDLELVGTFLGKLQKLLMIIGVLFEAASSLPANLPQPCELSLYFYRSPSHLRLFEATFQNKFQPTLWIERKFILYRTPNNQQHRKHSNCCHIHVTPYPFLQLQGAVKCKTCVKAITPIKTQAKTKPPPTCRVLELGSENPFRKSVTTKTNIFVEKGGHGQMLFCLGLAKGGR